MIEVYELACPQAGLQRARFGDICEPQFMAV